MANNVGPIGTVKVKIRDGSDYWVVELDNALQLSTDERSAKLLSQTGDDENFTLSYDDEHNRTWYLARSQTDVTFATAATSWEVSGSKLQIQGNANEQIKRSASGGLELACRGHDALLDPQTRKRRSARRRA